MFFNFADAKRVNQRSASDSKDFGLKRIKKASHLVKARKLAVAFPRAVGGPTWQLARQRRFP
jgi:hypothetical protein